MSDNPQTFLGLTKAKMAVIRVVLQVVTYVVLVVFAWQIVRLVEQGAQAHEALCGYKRAQVASLRSGEQLLKMTPAQMQAKYGAYGAVLAKTPRAVFVGSIRKERINVDSMRSLHCKPPVSTPRPSTRP